MMGLLKAYGVFLLVGNTVFFAWLGVIWWLSRRGR